MKRKKKNIEYRGEKKIEEKNLNVLLILELIFIVLIIGLGFNPFFDVTYNKTPIGRPNIYAIRVEIVVISKVSLNAAKILLQFTLIIVVDLVLLYTKMEQ